MFMFILFHNFVSLLHLIWPQIMTRAIPLPSLQMQNVAYLQHVRYVGIIN